MVRRLLGIVVLLTLPLLRPGSALAGDTTSPEATSAADARGRELLHQKLATLRGAERGQVMPVVEDVLARAFPGHLFYVLRFRQYPVALAPPDPLASNNLFVVRPNGSVEHLRDVGVLEVFFRAALRPVTTDAQAQDGARAWLRLAQEFRQDGFFQFSIPDDSLKVVSLANGGREVTGKVVVTPQGGNQGEIAVTLTFDARGSLVTVSESANIKRGIRPICQATKLLGPDPVVRGMAEEAILVMGKDAKEYLDEQRARARPELQEAIDRIWRRILSEDR
jgi:hypothetical protein